MQLKTFTFNAFQENTYVVFDQSKQCVIIDPGCYDKHEEDALTQYIDLAGLKPVLILNTHCHIDHVLGNAFVADKYNIPLQVPKNEEAGLKIALLYGQTFGFSMRESPKPASYIFDNDVLEFGNTKLQCISAPGHSVDSMCFYNHNTKTLFGGDVLFYQSIGRTDLPGGNHAQLIQSINTRLFSLPDDVIVYPGHGNPTQIGFEKKHNPFLK
jgi:hydroxyacylglutathione hydrolase